VLEQCGFSPESAQVTRDAPAYYHPGRSGTLRLGANVLGYFGELHPRVLEEMKCGAPASAFEIFIDAVPAAKNKSPAKKLLKLSALQPVRRDFAFVADEGLEVEKLSRAITAVDKALITEVSIFDVYQGKGVEPGKKSVALAVTLQPVDKTLTDAEIVTLSEKLVAAAAKAGASLRGT
jgi:phenylalanyl-tRNA synthetase beta chain